MVKIHCDRCGKEIKEEYYYTITIGKAELNPKCDYSIEACSTAYNYVPEKSPYEKLSSQKMYCERCRDDVVHTINHWVEAL